MTVNPWTQAALELEAQERAKHLAHTEPRLNSKGYDFKRDICLNEHRKMLSILHVCDYHAYVEFICDHVHPMIVKDEIFAVRSGERRSCGRIDNDALCRILVCESIIIKPVLGDSEIDLVLWYDSFSLIRTMRDPWMVLSENGLKGLFPGSCRDAFVFAVFMTGLSDDEIVHNMTENYRRNHRDPFNPLPPPSGTWSKAG